MADEYDVDINIDPSGYLYGVNQIDQANQALSRSMGGLVTQSTGVSRALGMITPGRATVAGMTLLAREAANTEQGLSGLAARSAVTGVNVEKLGKTIRQTARDFPLGYEAAKTTVETFAQMGVAAAGSEDKVASLTKTVTKLSGATGEGPQALAAGMVDLARASGNNTLDPKRFERLSDSLTTISANSGASASGILAFSKNIGPMAQAAGIGATGVLGISSAFAKIGEDGTAASTAVNKMLSDMNKSVREGSPEIKTYASFVGKSADEFERLFKANPAEALTQVTEAIAKAGPNGPHMLEQIGIEGIRGQRSLQALVASGGLRAGVSEAVNAYGNGSTDKASTEAFKGLNDSLTELQETLRQVSDAFGQPLLGPLTAFTNALKVPANVARSVVSSDFMQKAIQYGATAAIGVAIAKNFIAPIGALALGRQGLTSGPMRALAAGWAGTDRSTRLAAFGSEATRLQNETGNAGVGMMKGLSNTFYRFGAGLREGHEYNLQQRMTPQEYADRQARLQNPNVNSQRQFRSPLGVLRDWGRTGLMYGGQLTAAYGNMLNEQYRNARVYAGQATDANGKPIGDARTGNPISNRRSSWGFTPQMRMAWQDARFPNATYDRISREMTDTGPGVRPRLEAMKIFNQEMKQTATAAGSWREAAVAHAKALGQSVRLLGTLANDVRMVAGAGGGPATPQGRLQRIGTGIQSFGGKVGNFVQSMGGAGMLGVTGAMMIMQANQRHDAEMQATVGDYLGGDIQQNYNRYREQAGESVSPTITHGELGGVNLQSLARSTTTPEQALEITQADQTAADNSKNNVTTSYAGDAKAVAGQIMALNPTGLSPQVMQTVKVDLLRQFDQGTVKTILQSLPSSVFATGAARPEVPKGVDLGTIGNLASSIGNAPTAGGWSDINQQIQEGLSSVGAIGSEEDKWGAPKGNMTGYTGNLTPEAVSQIKNNLLGGIDTTYQSQKVYGEDYAAQNRYKSIDTAMQKAIDSGNVDMVYQMQQMLSSQLVGTDKAKQENAEYLTPDQIKALGGGSYVAALAAKDKDFGAGYNGLQDRAKAAGGQFQPVSEENPVAALASKTDAYLGAFFDDRKTGTANQAVTESMNAQGDIGKQSTAVNAIVQAAQSAGKPLGDLAVEAAKLASTMGSTTQEYAIMRATQMRAMQVMQGQAVMGGATESQTGLQTFQANVKLASMPHSNDPAIEQDRQQAEDDAKAYAQAQMGRMQARLQAQREYEVQVSRINEDAERQRGYAKADYDRQVQRANDAFNFQQAEAQYQFQTQTTRAQKDYDTQRLRTIRDFNIQAEHAERDMLKNRARAIRDFNIQISREIEDAAKTMYNPYQRIQTQATWDAKNLLVNMKEQDAAIAKQKEQLDQLRKMGLSDQAIDQLGLGKTENAQQVSNLVSDAMQDPKVLQQITDEAKNRAQATASLFTDNSNTDLKRQQEDFSKTLKDQAADYATAVKDNREALARGLSDSEADFKKSMTRATDDFNHQQSQAQKQLGITLTQMQQDYDRAYTRTQDAQATTLKRMAEDLKRADQTIAGDFKTMAANVGKALNGQAVDWTKIVKNDTQQWIKDMQTNVLPLIPKMFSAVGLAGGAAPAAPYTGSSAGSQLSTGHASGANMRINDYGGGYATGGEIQGYSPHPKADNIPIWATGGEFMHNVAAVKHYGKPFMEAINSKRVPKEFLQAMGFAAGGWIPPVNARPLAPWGHYPSGGVHKAVDYPVPTGTPVKAPYSGVIIKSGWSTTGFGNEIEMKNSTGTFSILGHNSKLIAGLGDIVRQGQIVSLSGSTGHSTGPHVHLEMRTSPYDPNTSYDFTNGTMMATLAQDQMMGIVRRMTANELFAGLDPHKGGVYGKLRDKIKAEYEAKYDDGGIMPPGTGTFHNETGQPERVLTAPQWAGISKLAQVGEHMITQNDLQGVRAAGGVHIVINNSGAVTYDNRNDFADANITVVSQDPDEMARKLEAKQVRQRITQTRSVRR